MTGPGCSGLSQGAGDSGRGYGFLGRDPSPGVIAHPGLVSLCPGAPPLARAAAPGAPGVPPRVSSRTCPRPEPALLEGGSRVVGALGRRRLLRGGVAVVQHGGDAVAHGTLVAPAGRHRGGVRLREAAQPESSHRGTVQSSLGPHRGHHTDSRGPSRDPGQLHPGTPTEQDPRCLLTAETCCREKVRPSVNREWASLCQGNTRGGRHRSLPAPLSPTGRNTRGINTQGPRECGRRLP